MSHAKHIVSRETKYPIFLIGLILMIGGTFVEMSLGMPLTVTAATVAVGFILFLLGIALG